MSAEVPVLCISESARVAIEESELRAMAGDLGADSLYYLPLEAVARCIGLDSNHLCRACITGKYPTPTGTQLYELALLNTHGPANGRTYELVNAASSVRKQ